MKSKKHVPKNIGFDINSSDNSDSELSLDARLIQRSNQLHNDYDDWKGFNRSHGEGLSISRRNYLESGLRRHGWVKSKGQWVKSGISG